MSDNIVAFSRHNSDEKKVDNLRKAAIGFGFKVMDGSNNLEFNVVVGQTQNTELKEPHVINVMHTENGWFFKADLASLDYGSRSIDMVLDRTKAHNLIQEGMENIRNQMPQIKLNGVEHHGVFQLRDVKHLENFTVVFMLGLSFKAKTNPIAMISELAYLPRANFKFEVV